MNIKKIVASMLVSVCAISTCAYAKTLEFTINEASYFAKDSSIEQKALDTAPYIDAETSRTMVPARVISESFGALVNWDAEAQTVTIVSGNNTIVLTIGKSEAMVNGETKLLDSPAVIKNGRTMVPLRFVSEELGKSVDYAQYSSQVLISDENPVMTIDGYPVTLDDYRFLFIYHNLADGRYEPRALVPYLTESIIEKTIIANEAKTKGYYLPVSQGASLADSIASDRDIYHPYSLTAPGVKTLSDTACAMNYFNQRFSYEFALERVVAEYVDQYVCAKHILIPTVDLETGEALTAIEQRWAKSTAETVYNSALKGDDFDALIKKYNADPGVEYNPDGYIFTVGEMVPEFEETAFELEEGEISKPVKTDFGYHIIKRCPLPELSEEFEQTLRQRMLESDMKIYMRDLISKSDIKIYMTDEEIIEKLNVTSEDIDAIINRIVASGN